MTILLKRYSDKSLIEMMDYLHKCRRLKTGKLSQINWVKTHPFDSEKLYIPKFKVIYSLNEIYKEVDRRGKRND